MFWLVTLGCSGDAPFSGPIPERPPGFVDPGLSSTGAGPVLDLPRLPATWSFPPSVLPAGFEPKAHFPLVLEEEPFKVRKTTSLYRAESPFTIVVEEEGRVSAPPGMQLFVGDAPLKYDPRSIGESWKLTEDSLVVASAHGRPAVSLYYPGLEKEIRRRDYSTSELSPEAFAQFSVTLGTRTRHGLLLPAPASAEWKGTIPAGATFEGWLAIAPLPLKQLASKGAEITLRVHPAQGDDLVDTQRVTPSADFTRWRVDLSKLAGQAATITLSTAPGADPDFDYVFVGSPQIWGSPQGEVRHVVVIGIDTTRPDHFGSYGYARDTTPELDLVAGTSAVFDHSWAPAPRTRPSFRTAFTGRRPLDAVGATNIAAVFQERGFATAGIVANVHLQPRFEFDEGFSDWWYDHRVKADVQVDRALAFLKDYQDRDTFLFLHIMDPHIFYDAPGRFKDMFTEDPDPDLPSVFTRWDVYEWMRKGSLTDRQKAQIAARYDGELRYTSQELGRLFDQMDRMGGHTLVVLHTDHGEELWDHGAFEHNHTLREETLRTLLWFRSGPGQVDGARISAPVTLADIAPTLYDFAAFQGAPPTDGRSLKGLLLGTEDPAPYAERPLGVGHLRYDREQWGVVWRGHKYVLHTASGQEELYDLAADPKEANDLAAQTDLAPYRAACAEAHGMTVERGWRIRVDLHGENAQGEYTITLPKAPTAFGVTDPEADLELPANQAWGEPPARVRSDIAAVTVEGTTLHITPGPKPTDGLLYVLFGEEIDVSRAVLLRGGAPVMTLGTAGRVSWKAGPDQIRIENATIVIPPQDEATRMRALSGDTVELTEAERKNLCELGYIECDKGPE